MVKIHLDFECTATDGKCIYKTPNCIDMDVNNKPWLCEWFRVTRQAQQ
jgi:hypothetical protein